MKIFVTGASGFIGSATTQALVATGHQVVGLARSDASAKKVKSLGATPLRGTVEDLETVKAGAKDADAVIHLAFNHDGASFAAHFPKDLAVLEAIASVLAGSNKRFIAVGGTLTAGKDEDTPIAYDPSQPVPRAKNDLAILALRERGIDAILVSLPPTCHGAGDGGLIPRILEGCLKAGYIARIEGGSNRWPACHRNDIAQLLRLAVESPSCPPRLHAVAEQGVPWSAITETLAKRHNLPIKQVDLEEAKPVMGHFAGFAAIDHTSSSEKTQKALGWTPREIGLLEDLAQNY